MTFGEGEGDPGRRRDNGIGLGARPVSGGVRFAVRSEEAERLFVCLFDEADRETGRIGLDRDGAVHSATVAGLAAGARYGLRAEGRYDPAAGLWFDPAKLLVDPYALAIDRAYRYDPLLAVHGADTGRLVPKAIVTALPDPLPPAAPRFAPGGLVYELPVRPFTILHPDVPPLQRGTTAALGHPAVIDHLVRLGVDTVELMPIAAWIDERHLPPLGLTNGWGYNPVGFLALDPRLAPGGIAELRTAVAALHEAGIGVILDVVFNHSGESDARGPTLSLRGLDNRVYYRHADDGAPINDTGCGNTIACEHPAVRRLILDTLRHFVAQAGADGFRFDLAPVLARGAGGFDPRAPLFAQIAADPLLADRVLIAEPWDIGPGGYQLGRFPPPFLEWNDRYRDDVRRFWRGDGRIGDLATRLAGSSDLFAGAATRSVNFVAAHDGFALADVVAYQGRHNERNGEDNRDGHHDNASWNNGVEGATDDAGVRAARRSDAAALLATLFASRGTIQLTAGDEFGRSRQGNNNAYAQDNVLTWLDWTARDRELEAFVASLAAFRRRHPALRDARFLGDSDVAWLTPAGAPMTAEDWNDPAAPGLAMRLGGIAILFNRSRAPILFSVPGRRRQGIASLSSVIPARAGIHSPSGIDPGAAVASMDSRLRGNDGEGGTGYRFTVPPRAVLFVEEA